MTELLFSERNTTSKAPEMVIVKLYDLFVVQQVNSLNALSVDLCMHF